jgi:hypothetical protein
MHPDILPWQRLALALTLVSIALPAVAQQPATSGTFVLHKFAKEIGKETYTIDTTGEDYNLTAHFLFTDRGTPVPLDTTFIARSVDMKPRAYQAKGNASRTAEMDDLITVSGEDISITRNGKSQTLTPAGSWFIADGYSPVAMQEQMMRWWLRHGQPALFTVFPANTKVHIEPAETLTVDTTQAHGYTVSGLIWGQESLWMDDAQDLVALVSTDAEFDHFEAIRKPFEADLGTFIASAVKSSLAGLTRLSAEARMPAPHVLAITGATLENSTGAAPIRDSVILIEDGVIKAAGAKKQVPVPKGATILDARGKFAIPGLWDMHAHYEQVEWGAIYLASGITSVRDVGNEFDFIRTLHQKLDAKPPALGRHLEFAGLIDGSGPITPDEARAWVDKYKAAGARQIKIYSSVRPEIVKAITAEAHAQGLTVTGHVPDGMSAIEGVDDGMDQINHIQYLTSYFSHPVLGEDGKPDDSQPPVLELDSARGKDLIATLQAHHTILDPTVALFETFTNTVPLDQLEPGLNHVAPQLRAVLDNPPATGARAMVAAGNWQVIMATLRTLHAAGIPMVAGTDQAIPGYSLHRELELYVEAGFTPLQAIEAATIEPARALGVEKESGSIEPGKRGDVLLLDADPLSDIHNTRRVWRTVAAGAVYDPAPLWSSVGFAP